MNQKRDHACERCAELEALRDRLTAAAQEADEAASRAIRRRGRYDKAIQRALAILDEVDAREDLSDTESAVWEILSAVVEPKEGG